MPVESEELHVPRLCLALYFTGFRASILKSVDKPILKLCGCTVRKVNSPARATGREASNFVFFESTDREFRSIRNNFRATLLSFWSQTKLLKTYPQP